MIARAAAMAAVLLVAGSAEARPRAATCAVRSAGEHPWSGPCIFEGVTGGSFSIAPMRNRRFPGGITSVTVSIVRPGLAEVRGLTREGINSRWGSARRSRRDPACWDGPGFGVCAY
jgi:hypothetical protein